MKNTVQTSRDNNMGMLHLVAALFVMYGHHCALLNQVPPYLFGCAIQSIGVKTIFLISGYLITKSLWNIKGSRGKVSVIYGIKRLGRIYPELFGCLLFSALIVGPLFTDLSQVEYWENSGAIIQYIKYNLCMFPVYGLPGMFVSNPYPNAVNGSLWTMPVEIFLYLLILIIFLVSKNEAIRKKVYGIITLAITALFLARVMFFPSESLVIYGTDWVQALNVMPYFLIGGVAWLFDWERYMNLQVSTVFLFVFAGGLTLSTPIVNEGLCLVFLSYFVLSLMVVSEQKLKLHRIRGEYAYGMYLYGFVVQQCVISVVFENRNVTTTNFYITYAVCVVLTYFIAMLSYKYIYKPVNKIVGKFLNKYNHEKAVA